MLLSSPAPVLHTETGVFVCRWLLAAEIAFGLQAHLLGYWNFEDGPSSPTARDASGNGHTGRIHGGRHDASKWPQSGLAGGSFAQDFRGTVDDTIIVDNKAGFPTGNSPRTTMFWCDPIASLLPCLLPPVSVQSALDDAHTSLGPVMQDAELWR